MVVVEAALLLLSLSFLILQWFFVWCHPKKNVKMTMNARSKRMTKKQAEV